MAKAPDLSYIAEGLRSLAVPVELLDLLEKNPRKGDVDALAAILTEFGQREPFIVRPSKTTEGRYEVEAGNHRTLAARKLGWTHVAVLIVDDDDGRAAAFSLVHNHAHDLGSYDREVLDEMMAKFVVPSIETKDSLSDMFAAVHWDAASLDDLAKPEKPKVGGYNPEPGDDKNIVPQFAVIVVCRDEEQQVAVYERLVGEYDEVRVVNV